MRFKFIGDIIVLTPLLAVILYDDFGKIVSEWTIRAIEVINPALLLFILSSLFLLPRLLDLYFIYFGIKKRGRE